MKLLALAGIEFRSSGSFLVLRLVEVYEKSVPTRKVYGI